MARMQVGFIQNLESAWGQSILKLPARSHEHMTGMLADATFKNECLCRGVYDLQTCFLHSTMTALS